MLCFVREKRAQLTHGTRGKELSTGMDGSIPLLLRVNVGNRLPGSPLMDMKKDPLGCLTCPQKLKGSFPS